MTQIIFAIFAIAFARFAYLVWSELRRNYKKSQNKEEVEKGISGAIYGAAVTFAAITFGLIALLGKYPRITLVDYQLEWNIFDIIWITLGLLVIIPILWIKNK